MAKKQSFRWLISNSPHDNVGELGGELEMSELEMQNQGMVNHLVWMVLVVRGSLVDPKLFSRVANLPRLGMVFGGLLEALRSL